MKTSIMLLSGLAPAAFGFALNQRAACNADNCARAVTGTAFGAAASSSHMAQCSSYFSTTIVPPSTTVFSPVATSYVLSTVGAVLPTPVALLQSPGTSTTIVPTDIPAFASQACNGNTTPVPVRFSSACSCGGVSQAITTALPQPPSWSTLLHRPSPTLSFRQPHHPLLRRNTCSRLGLTSDLHRTFIRPRHL